MVGVGVPAQNNCDNCSELGHYQGHYLIMMYVPSIVCRIYWDCLVIFMLLFTVIVLPVSIAFYSDKQLQPQWVTMNVLVDFIFFLDILILFRTGVLSKKIRDKVNIHIYVANANYVLL